MIRTIVLPAYNEEGYILHMVDRTIRAAEMRPDPFEILVINNASSDNTAHVVSEIAARDSRVILISHDENRFYAGSCRTGVRSSRGDRIFILDSDGQHTPEDIWKFDKKLDEGYDIVFGHRRKRSESIFRLMMSQLLLFYSRFFIKFDLHDVNCGVRAFNRKFANMVDIRYQINMVNPELFVRAKMGGFLVGEVEVIQENRKAGVTSHELGHLWKTHRYIVSYLFQLSHEMKGSPEK